MDGWGGLTGRWVDGWMDGWVDGRVGGWTVEVAMMIHGIAVVVVGSRTI